MGDKWQSVAALTLRFSGKEGGCEVMLRFSEPTGPV